MHQNAWRAILAALADDRAREIYARIVLAQPIDEALATIPPKKAQRITESLTAAGLVSATAEGLVAVPDVFARALASASGPARREGVDRFLEDGRVVGMPARATDRQALLEHLATRVLAPGDTVSEAEINARLAGVTDDVAGLRRAFVDHGLLVRTADGSVYSRA
ncbi:hypothetical protein NS206_04630 [Microbacterium testaceum]|uniref:DUF2087 domain-containing protein n=1 Tax=Microbacterium TaxID=33882 RepID=UPI000733DF63|nr:MULTISPECIES: DUF2087 domain-containing protein [Microbacterium]KTS65365.1 hypothetical protein NS206_04630 [Microbacterium testaceum]MDF2045394.1 DUF2087 domain-containing protein [Microbacterium sp. Kw_RZR3]